MPRNCFLTFICHVAWRKLSVFCGVVRAVRMVPDILWICRRERWRLIWYVMHPIEAYSQSDDEHLNCWKPRVVSRARTCENSRRASSHQAGVMVLPRHSQASNVSASPSLPII